MDARSTKDLPKAALALFRRVDLFAPPAVDNPEPAPKAPPKPTCTSNHWRARMLARSSIPIPSLPGEHGGRPGIGLAPEWFDVEIEDRDGRCGSKVFTFRAQGVGIGFSMNPTGDWADFDTSKQVGLGQFEGWAVHVAVQATVAGPLGSGSWDLLTMYGPQLWAGADPAVARWLSVAVHGFPGAEVTVSGGGLHP